MDECIPDAGHPYHLGAKGQQKTGNDPTTKAICGTGRSSGNAI